MSAETPSDMNSTASIPLPKISPSTGPTGSPPPLNPNNNGLATSTVIGITIGVVLFFVFLLVIGLFFYFRDQERRRRPVSFRRMQRPLDDMPGGIQQQSPPGLTRIVLGCRDFSREELDEATDGFSVSNLLGEGGFGYVYKGSLPNGQLVAVKKLKSGSRQGDREFQAEVEAISRVHHRYLVTLAGYCTSDDERMLVYEFVPNNTLEFHLHGKNMSSLNWQTRRQIAIGSARGLVYLHEDCNPKIIHRDIKASNILLDENFEPKVADFGLAKFSSDTESHVSTRVMGTFGYMAPEYASSGRLTAKSDVFSFGVVLLELITGRKPNDKNHPFKEGSLVEWARPLLSQALQNGNFNGLVDPRLQTNYNPDEMIRMITCAAACVLNSPRSRPRMSQVVLALEGFISLEDLKVGSSPGPSNASDSFDSRQYSEDLKNFRKLVLESQGQGISEYSGPSSEYGRHPSVSTSTSLQNTQEIEMENVKGSNHDSGISS